MAGMMNDPRTPLSTRLGLHLFFLAHMTGFGSLLFYLNYHRQQGDYYAVGIIPALIYLLFFLMFFGLDEILWLVITSALGLTMIYGWLEKLAQLFIPAPGTAADWVLTDFGQFPARRHMLPATFIMMYEFTLRNLLIDALGARHDPRRNRLVGWLLLSITCAQVLIARFAEGASTTSAVWSLCVLVLGIPLLSALVSVMLRRRPGVGVAPASTVMREES